MVAAGVRRTAGYNYVGAANLELSPDTDMGWTGQQVGATRAGS